MSTAVYYSNHNMPVEDVHSKHTLPSLSQIMPPMSQHDAQQAQQQLNATSSHPGHVSPYMVNQNIAYGNTTGGTATAYQTQPSPELFSQSGSQPSSLNTTPASSFSGGSTSNYITSNLPNGNTEKCTCKSNSNRIPRPRNAFILFRQKYHQSVLDEGNVIRTNPEVSRELGRRWRSLSSEEKEHWNNLAEEEKKNHAKKYPGYRYTPRRNGKSKGCPACRQKAFRQKQVQLHNQQLIQSQQDQYQQYLQIQQAQQVQQQQAAAAAAAAVGMQTQQGLGNQGANGQMSLQQNNSQIPLQQNNTYIPQGMSQFVVQSNPFPQQNFQFSFGDQSQQPNHLQAQQQQQQQQQQLQPPQPHDKLSPLSAPANQFSTNSSMSNGEFMAPMNPQFAIGYDSNHQQQHMGGQQRFNSLPTPVSNGSTYGFDVFNMPQQNQQ